MIHRLVFAAVLLSSLLLADPARAGRPLQTEDAGILDAGACEVEGVTARLSAFGSAARDASLQFGCGVGGATQLALTVARSRTDGARASGLRLGGKTGLWRGEGDDAPALALAYGLAGSKVAGDGWRLASTAFNLVYSRPAFAELTLHANLGHARDEPAGQRGTTWGLALEHIGIGAVAPMAELFGDDREAPWWNVGLRYTVAPERFYIDASYGRQIGVGRARLWTLGFKLAF